MSYFNNSRFGKEVKVLTNSPFNTEFDQEGISPPPASSLMITEVGNLFMLIESGGSLMITES